MEDKSHCWVKKKYYLWIEEIQLMGQTEYFIYSGKELLPWGEPKRIVIHGATKNYTMKSRKEHGKYDYCWWTWSQLYFLYYRDFRKNTNRSKLERKSPCKAMNLWFIYASCWPYVKCGWINLLYVFNEIKIKQL